MVRASFVEDMPKIHSPFVRKETDGKYCVTPQVEEGYEWVFEDDRVLAVEKLHGTNVSCLMEGGEVVGVWTRSRRIPAFSKNQNDQYILEGIYNSLLRGYMDRLLDGQHFGELIGPKVNGNPYQLEEHIWIPFQSYAEKHLSYESWGRYPKTFEAIKGWFEHGLIPLFHARWHNQSFSEAEGAFVEGIMFTHPAPDELETPPYAKLRYDMWPFYDGPEIH